MSASYYISPCHASIQQSSHPNLVPVESMKMSMKSIKNALGFKGAKRLARENETYSTPAQFTRPDVPTDPPPAYHAQALLPSASLSLADTTPVNALSDDRYEFLKSFDTIFLIDDSGSMAGSRWREVSHALECIAPICTRYDKDGIDIKFLNSREQRRHSNIIDATTVHEIFEAVRPGGGTPTGQRLNTILKEHLRQLESNPAKPPKPVNIIVITDGEPTDDVESPIINAARKLDKLDAEPWQIGVQFFQVGGDSFAKHHLEALDDNLSEIGGGCRDIVDTVPFLPGRVLEADFILKIVLGAVNKRLDRRHNPTR